MNVATSERRQYFSGVDKMGGYLMSDGATSFKRSVMTSTLISSKVL